MLLWEGPQIGQGSFCIDKIEGKAYLVNQIAFGDEIHHDLIIVVIVSGKYTIANWKGFDRN